MRKSLLKKWYFWATHSRLQPIMEAAHTIKRHWDGVLQWFKSRITNGVLEGINSLIQAAKARARGYRTTKNLIAMIYLIGGNLKFGLPTWNSEEPFFCAGQKRSIFPANTEENRDVLISPISPSSSAWGMVREVYGTVAISNSLKLTSFILITNCILSLTAIFA